MAYWPSSNVDNLVPFCIWVISTTPGSMICSNCWTTERNTSKHWTLKQLYNTELTDLWAASWLKVRLHHVTKLWNWENASNWFVIILKWDSQKFDRVNVCQALVFIKPSHSKIIFLRIIVSTINCGTFYNFIDHWLKALKRYTRFHDFSY